MATINISLPQSMYNDVKKLMKRKHYASISEVMRDSLRHMLYPRITENGFTPEFEEEVLRRAAEPVEDDIVLETNKEIEDYFLHLKLPKKKHVKS